MRRSTSIRTVTPIVAAVVLIAAIAAVATGAFGYSPSSSPSPTATPAPLPTAAPTVKPTTPPSIEPSSPPAGGVFQVDLRNPLEFDVVLAIDDETHSVVKAESGTPGDGMSVRWFDVKVENIDETTLRVVWVGLPRDEVVRLGVSHVDDKVRLRFVQAAPPAQSDAMGSDRVLRLMFAVPVRAEDVLVSMQESLDTAD